MMTFDSIYLERDDNVSLNAEVIDDKIMTWDNIHIEGLEGAEIQGIDIVGNAGDVISCSVFYYSKEDPSKIVSETFNLKKLSFQTQFRETDDEYELKRKEIIGLKEKRYET